MKHIYLTILILISSAKAFSQDSIALYRYKEVVFNTTIRHTTSKTHDVTKGTLVNITDSSLVLSPTAIPFLLLMPRDTFSIPYSSITSVTLRKKGGAGRGALWGLLIGATSGIVTGFISGDDPKGQIMSFSAGTKATAFGIIFGLLGTATGIVIGSLPRQSFYINKKQAAVKNMRATLLEQLYLK
jgi:hypothetical protein